MSIDMLQKIIIIFIVNLSDQTNITSLGQQQ